MHTPRGERTTGAVDKGQAELWDQADYGTRQNTKLSDNLTLQVGTMGPGKTRRILLVVVAFFLFVSLVNQKINERMYM